MSEQTSNPPASFAKRVLALFLDFLTIFFPGAYFIGWLTGSLTGNDVTLESAPALALFAVIWAYFYGGWKFAGGMIWESHFGHPPPATLLKQQRAGGSTACRLRGCAKHPLWDLKANIAA